MKNLGIEVPRRLIAQYPASKREDSRLLIYRINSGRITDDRFSNIADYIRPDDCVVYNDARVINARLQGKKRLTGALLEVLLLKRRTAEEWECLIRPARRVKEEAEVSIEAEVPNRLSFLVKHLFGNGRFLIRFSEPVGYEDLEKIGTIPLPKYIKRPVEALDSERYQTVFSERFGAVASPTAGLHFTEDSISRIKGQGTLWVPLTLYVDWGTFQPVREDDYRCHTIHSEAFDISEASAETINRALERKRRVLCVGTTSVRALESAYESGRVKKGSGETDLYIYPGYRFKVTEGMITNFHLPDSTLILLVMAFAGVEGIREVYRHAVREEYRFFSYGDAMLLTKD
ncbi:MAG: tRNA preQ1(34) S-adenosylmethionine ribosyltransferase-isomerase QueA [Spirochaetes bacterium]|nr:tRNA preQ1(34) S-adenosylmethionine ribosyltransferase-isomerase QueA [Spirochaetota bacterium]